MRSTRGAEGAPAPGCHPQTMAGDLRKTTKQTGLRSSRTIAVEYDRHFAEPNTLRHYYKYTRTLTRTIVQSLHSPACIMHAPAHLSAYVGIAASPQGEA